MFKKVGGCVTATSTANSKIIVNFSQTYLEWMYLVQ